MTIWLRTVVLAALLSMASLSSAHEMTMAEVEIRQISRTDFVWHWMTNEKRPASEELKIVWPDGCADDSNLLHCGEAGLRGILRVDGVGKHYSAAIVRVFWLDGQLRAYTITAAQPTARLYGAANDDRNALEVASAYVVLGIEHILTGIDHLMFVIALLFLVGFNRRLLWTITAFTVAHSVTLALSALGVIALRAPPVEATIALSIVLVAVEALDRKQTFARRWPAIVAFLFGLVHGLGFAGALKEIGLPHNHLLVALLTFNVGVELGQLFVVTAAFVIYKSLARMPKLALARVASLYVIGSVAAWWSIGRVVDIFG